MSKKTTNKLTKEEKIEKSTSLAMKLLSQATPRNLIKRRVIEKYQITEYTANKILDTCMEDITADASIKNQIIYSYSNLLSHIDDIVETTDPDDSFTKIQALKLKQSTLASLQRIELESKEEEDTIDEETIIKAIKHSLT